MYLCVLVVSILSLFLRVCDWILTMWYCCFFLHFIQHCYIETCDSSGTPVSSANITEILLKVALNTIILSLINFKFRMREVVHHCVAITTIMMTSPKNYNCEAITTIMMTSPKNYNCEAITTIMMTSPKNYNCDEK